MNSFGNVIRPLSWFIAVSLAAVVAGCGGGGGDGPAPARPGPVADAAPIGNISGVWTMTETGITSPAPECQPPGNALATYPVTFTQTGNSNTISLDGDRANNTPPTTFAGTLKGNAATWSGRFAERGGITTINSLTSTVSSDCNGLSGTSNWTYVGDAPSTFTCTGTTQFTGTRNTAVTSCAQSPS